MSLGWELSFITGAVLGNVPKICIVHVTRMGVVFYYWGGTGKCTENLYCTKVKSTGKVRVKTLIFTVFNGNGGIFALGRLSLLF